MTDSRYRYGDEIKTAAVPERAAGRPSLRVFGEGLYEAHVLPAAGELTLGRSAQADVRIDHPSVSRVHAVLRLGDRITVEDLGSANGTRVGGVKLDAKQPVEVAVGEPIDLGEVTVVVQAPSLPTPSRRAPPASERERGAAGTPGGVVIADAAMERLYRLVERVAAGNVSVLLLGETGVGKEVVAEALHRASPRADKPFLRLNCAAFTETLLESELFGYEKGAFSGAAQTKPGLLETANGGTVFLDEIGEMPLSLQAKLLRVIEQRRVLRLGGLKDRAIDVRFVAATNRDLSDEIAGGRFRQDLYYRLDGISIAIPPLRERRGEIEALARLFITRATPPGERPPSLSPAALAALRDYSWPGNIRELRNVVERAVLLSGGDTIEPEHVPLGRAPARTSGNEPTAPMTPPTPPASAPLAGDDERERIIQALQQCAGNQTHAARLLGISRGTLLARLDEYNLPRPRPRKPKD